MIHTCHPIGDSIPPLMYPEYHPIQLQVSITHSPLIERRYNRILLTTTIRHASLNCNYRNLGIPDAKEKVGYLRDPAERTLGVLDEKEKVGKCLGPAGSHVNPTLESFGFPFLRLRVTAYGETVSYTHLTLPTKA